MDYLIGVIFLSIGIWQLVITKRTLTDLKKEGDKNTSPFIILGLWNSLIFAIIFIGIAIGCFFFDF
jgi:hypothetical protein